MKKKEKHRKKKAAVVLGVVLILLLLGTGSVVYILLQKDTETTVIVDPRHRVDLTSLHYDAATADCGVDYTQPPDGHMWAVTPTGFEPTGAENGARVQVDHPDGGRIAVGYGHAYLHPGAPNEVLLNGGWLVHYDADGRPVWWVDDVGEWGLEHAVGTEDGVIVFAMWDGPTTWTLGQNEANETTVEGTGNPTWLMAEYGFDGRLHWAKTLATDVSEIQGAVTPDGFAVLVELGWRDIQGVIDPEDAAVTAPGTEEMPYNLVLAWFDDAGTYQDHVHIASNSGFDRYNGGIFSDLVSTPAGSLYAAIGVHGRAEVGIGAKDQISRVADEDTQRFLVKIGTDRKVAWVDAPTGETFIQYLMPVGADGVLATGSINRRGSDTFHYDVDDSRVGVTTTGGNVFALYLPDGRVQWARGGGDFETDLVGIMPLADGTFMTHSRTDITTTGVWGACQGDGLHFLAGNHVLAKWDLNGSLHGAWWLEASHHSEVNLITETAEGLAIDMDGWIDGPIRMAANTDHEILIPEPKLRSGETADAVARVHVKLERLAVPVDPTDPIDPTDPNGPNNPQDPGQGPDPFTATCDLSISGGGGSGPLAGYYYASDACRLDGLGAPDSLTAYQTAVAIVEWENGATTTAVNATWQSDACSTSNGDPDGCFLSGAHGADGPLVLATTGVAYTDHVEQGLRLVIRVEGIAPLGQDVKVTVTLA